MIGQGLCSCLLLLVLLPSPLFAQEVGVAFWNVENLFDTHDDPRVENDEEFTPDAPKNWTEERLQKKLDNLVDVIGGMFQGKGPDILGLSEVENRAVVERLAFRLQHLGRNYQIVHQDSASGRGIDCALLYDCDVFELHHVRFHEVEGRQTRDIVEAELVRGGDPLTVFVNHWPSRNNPESHRIDAAEVLRHRLDELLSVKPSADIVIIGDFNDHPDNVSIHETLNAKTQSANLVGNQLFNSTARLPSDGPAGTYVYDNKWDVIDHVILSSGLLDNEGFRWLPGSTRPLQVIDAQLFRPQPPNIPRPNRTYSRDRYHPDGYSDHLPVGCILKRPENPQ